MSNAGAARPRTAGKKGPRPKHVPQRMCVSCREHAAKRSLVRVVRTPEGRIEIDPTGRKNGRGAYLCDRPACWDRALKSGGLARALNAPLTQETIDELRRYAASLPTAEPGADAPQEGIG